LSAVKLCSHETREQTDQLYCIFQDTEVLLVQLMKDKEAVDEVRQIVEHEEAIMKKETQIVQDYADVSTGYNTLVNLYERIYMRELPLYSKATPNLFLVLELGSNFVILKSKALKCNGCTQ